jgi:haloacetate dehalogenase
MLANSAEAFLRGIFELGVSVRMQLKSRMFAEYLRAFTLPGTIRATLEDYRAGATVDIADDERDLGKKLSCPVLAIWGEQGKMHALFDVLATWRDKAADVRGHSLPCGHFIPEEAPAELLRDLNTFWGTAIDNGMCRGRRALGVRCVARLQR